MKRDNYDSASPQQIETRTKLWGWEIPTREVLELAETSLRWRQMRSGQILVELGLVSQARVEELLAARPAGIMTLEWFASNDPKIRSHIERILTLQKGYAFYDSLSELAEHPALKDPEVGRRANDLDAALMLIESVTPVLVFSSWQGLFDYSQISHEKRVTDPIRKVAGGNFRLAVSRTEEIAVVLRSTGMTREGDASGDVEAVWHGGSRSDSDAQRALARLIDQGISMNATDMALVPAKDGSVTVLFRRYGELVSPRGRASRSSGDGKRKDGNKARVDDTVRLEPSVAEEAVRFLAQRSGANPNATRMTEPADGQITYRSQAGDVFLRMSFIPLQHPGERRDLISVSARLLPRVEKSVSVDELHLAKPVRDQIDLAMRLSSGLILLAGPTNSGKSTTIAGAIGLHVDRFGKSKKRVSVEDPIERFLFGMTQVNAKHRSTRDGLGGDDRFNIILRAFKRHDPDLILVGEIRDQATADVCVSSATSGHLVLATIHANDAIMAADVLARMVDEKLSFQLMESLSMIISQRLVRTLCPHCKVEREVNDEDRRVWRHYCEGIGDHVELPEKMSSPVGCADPNCDEGYSGMLPINEVLPFSRKAKTLGAQLLHDPSARAELAELRTVKLAEEGVRLIREGLTDVDSILV